MKTDTYTQITNRVIELIETHGANWTKPWKGTGGSSRLPTSIGSGKPYTGVNTLLLWAEGRSDGRWGTYKAWAEKGAQVRKGEKATHIIFYKSLGIKEKQPDGSSKDKTVPLLKTFAVFCADQVDGLPEVAPAAPETAAEADHRVKAALDFGFATGADISVVTGSDRAFYSPGQDRIVIPAITDFFGTETSSAQEAYCSTLLHELTHWTGHSSRLSRLKSCSFGDADYATEELVAELGATFLCADLGITAEPRADHGQYLACWLKKLKDDKKLILRAASAASKAVALLHSLQPGAAAELEAA